LNKLFSEVLQTEAKERGLSPNDVARLFSLSRKVGEIESNNIASRTQGDTSDGIGRGKYQFESAKGSNAAKTAANRLIQWEDKHKTLDLSQEERAELSKDSPDFSKLSEDAQDALFIINLSVAEGVPLTDIAKGNIDEKEAWIRYHWAGSEDQRLSKEQMWDSRFSEKAQISKRAQIAKTFPEALL